MSIGWRGTVVAEPTCRGGPGSREASLPTHWIPVCCRPGAKLGLSCGCWGRIFTPEYSPVISSAGLIGRLFFLAHAMLSLIWLTMSLCGIHCVAPVDGSVAHRQGITVKSCTQPRNSWL